MAIVLKKMVNIYDRHLLKLLTLQEINLLANIFYKKNILDFLVRFSQLFILLAIAFKLQPFLQLVIRIRRTPRDQKKIYKK